MEKKFYGNLKRQGGFAEGCQYRCGEQFLKKLPGYLGCSYGGCLVKGDNFSIRLLNKEQQEKATKPYERMGEVFAIEHNFYGREARDFTGAEYYSLPERIMVGMAFRTIVRRIFNRAAKSWGCKDKLVREKALDRCCLGNYNNTYWSISGKTGRSVWN